MKNKLIILLLLMTTFAVVLAGMPNNSENVSAEDVDTELSTATTNVLNESNAGKSPAEMNKVEFSGRMPDGRFVVVLSRPGFVRHSVSEVTPEDNKGQLLVYVGNPPVLLTVPFNFKMSVLRDGGTIDISNLYGVIESVEANGTTVKKVYKISYHHSAQPSGGPDTITVEESRLEKKPGEERFSKVGETQTHVLDIASGVTPTGGALNSPGGQTEIGQVLPTGGALNSPGGQTELNYIYTGSMFIKNEQDEVVQQLPAPKVTPDANGNITVTMNSPSTILRIGQTFDTHLRTEGSAMGSETDSILIRLPVFSGNDASKEGGGILNSGGSVNVRQSNVSGNESGEGGGAVYLLNDSVSISPRAYSSGESIEVIPIETIIRGNTIELRIGSSDSTYINMVLGFGVVSNFNGAFVEQYLELLPPLQTNLRTSADIVYPPLFPLKFGLVKINLSAGNINQGVAEELTETMLNSALKESVREEVGINGISINLDGTTNYGGTFNQPPSSRQPTERENPNAVFHFSPPTDAERQPAPPEEDMGVVAKSLGDILTQTSTPTTGGRVLNFAAIFDSDNTVLGSNPPPEYSGSAPLNAIIGRWGDYGEYSFLNLPVKCELRCPGQSPQEVPCPGASISIE